jgi:uncharacterized membrane protein
MTWLILGLILFLGPHSVRIFADDWRTRTIESVGDKTFKGVYTVLTLLGFYATSSGTEATPVAKMSRTLAALVIGTLVWGGITFYLHAIVVGVSPLG